MLKVSHILVGSAVYDYLSEKHGIVLDRTAFLAGCILPDINQYYSVGHPHFPGLSMNFIQKEAAELSETYPRTVSDVICPEYSLKLGIILHYYGDFFCHAHSSRFRQLIINHIKYEHKLHRYLKSNLIRILHGLKYMENIGSSASEINRSMKLLYSEYGSKKQSFETDITYILLACSQFALSTINCSYRCGVPDEDEFLSPVPAG